MPTASLTLTLALDTRDLGVTAQAGGNRPEDHDLMARAVCVWEEGSLDHPKGKQASL